MASPHAPLISALTTFYSLLIDLRYLPASSLVLPPSQTRRYPHNSINREAATRNGFSDAAIELAYQIRYVTDTDYHLNYETRPLCYLARMPGTTSEWEKETELEEGEGEDPWEYARDPTYQERDDLWTGSNALVLTQGAVYGKELIYDLDAQTITEWQHFEDLHDPPHWRHCPAYPMSSPKNPIYTWIRAFLALQNIPRDSDIMIPQQPEEHGYSLDDTDQEAMQPWRERVEKYRKEMALKDVYIQCGWKVDTVEGLEDEKQPPIWETLEQARQRAGEEFRGDYFEQCRDEWDETVCMGEYI